MSHRLRPDAARPDLLVVTAEDGERPSPVAEHTVDVVARLADRGLDTWVLAWGDDPPVTRLLPTSVPVISPLALNEVAVVAALRRHGRTEEASRLKDGLFRAWWGVGRQRATPVLIDGLSGAPVVPWLAWHSAPVVWHLHEGEVPEAGSLAGLAGRRRPAIALAVAVEPEACDRLRGAGVAARVEQVEPHRADPVPPAPASDDVILGLVGDPDLDHGADLVGRFLWELQSARGRSTAVRWAVPGTWRITGQLHHDLRRLGLAGTVELVEVSGDLRPFLALVHVLVLPWRHDVDGAGVGGVPLASSGLELVVRAAAAAGRPAVAFVPDRPLRPGAPGTLVDYPALDLLAARTAASLGDWPALSQATANAYGGDALVERLLAVLAPPSGRAAGLKR